MRIWPDLLPGPSAPYDLSPVDAALRTEMEAGPRRSRRITRARRDVVDATWVMTKAEFELFRDWFDDAPRSLTGDSDDLSGWTVTDAAVVANDLLGPDDVLADLVRENGANSSHFATRDLDGAVPDDVTVAATLTMRASGRTAGRLMLVRKDGGSAAGTIDLVTGAIADLTGGASATALSRGGGWWRIALQAPIGAGLVTPGLRVVLVGPAGATSYLGNGGSGVHVCEAMARRATGFDLFGRTGPDGRMTGAAGGSAWTLMPLTFGGTLKTCQARFEGPFNATVLPGLGWRVSARLEVKDA
jgi:hypothetical protein